MEMGFFDTFTVVSLGVRQAEQTLLEKITGAWVNFALGFSNRILTYSSPFQNVKAIFCKPWVSETPAIPSSPQRKVRDRAWSCEKSTSC